MTAQLTPSHCQDGAYLPTLLRGVKETSSPSYGLDGIYDQTGVYQTLFQRGIKGIILPHQGALPSKGDIRQILGRKQPFTHEHPNLLHRDQAIIFKDQFMDQKEGLRKWKQSSGYYGIRSLVETAIMRFKRTFTDKLRARKISRQQAKVKIKASILSFDANHNYFPRYLNFLRDWF